jgi:hypothetical protein
MLTPANSRASTIVMFSAVAQQKAAVAMKLGSFMFLMLRTACPARTLIGVRAARFNNIPPRNQ